MLMVEFPTTIKYRERVMSYMDRNAAYSDSIWELSSEEIDNVSGNGGVPGAAIGAALGGLFGGY
jgi:hypothetical protein